MSRTAILGTVSAILGIAISLVLLEGGIRLLGLSSGLTYQPDPDFGWKHTAGHSYTYYVEDREIPVSINSRGLRDDDYSYTKPADSLRILLLGDSLTEALQVRKEDSFADLLEQQLNDKAEKDSRPVIQVINSGTSGYGTDNELLFFRHEGRKYQPDIVTLVLYIGNDIRNNWHVLENLDTGGTQKPYFSLSGSELQVHDYPFVRQESVFSKAKLFLNTHVRLYSFLRELRNNFRHSDALEVMGMPLDFNLFLSEYPQEWQEAWNVTEALILKLDREVRDSGARLYVVVIPSQMQVHEQIWESQVSVFTDMKDRQWDRDKPNRRLDAFLEQHRIPFTDLLAGFRQHSTTSGEELYLRSDGHLNEQGHQLATGLIGNGLIESGLLKP